MICAQCGKENDDTATVCSNCGAELNAAGLSGNSEEFYKAVIGPKRQAYYLRHFARFDQAGRAGISWNWAALFVTFYWFLYRKMWLNALIYFLLPILLLIVVSKAAIMAGEHNSITFYSGFFVSLAGLVFIPPMYANALYYNYCRKKISGIRVVSRDTQRQLGELSGKGGTSNAFAMVFFIAVFSVPAGIWAWLGVIGYTSSVVLSHTKRAYAIGKSAAEAFSNYYYQHQEPPRSLDQAGFTTPLPPFVKGVSLDSQNSTVVVTMASDPVKGKSLLFVPSIDASGKFTWACISRDMQDHYVPLKCKKLK